MIFLLLSGGGSRLTKFFSTKIPNLKKFFFFFGGGGGGRGGGRGRWMDRRTGPIQFAPSTSSKLGA